MAVIGNRPNIAVNIRAEMTSSLAMVNTTGNNVPQMRNHAGCNKQLTVSVVINTPRIAESMGDHLKAIFCRVIPPYTAVDISGLIGKLDLLREIIVVTIEPTFASRLAHS